MKTIQSILDNYKRYETFLDDRLGRRLCEFLTEEQAAKIGFFKQEGAVWETPKDWTEENVLVQLKEDVAFGWEKACAERGISSNLMFDTVVAWCKILENGLDYCAVYAPYGKPFFKKVDQYYDWGITTDC